MRISIFENYRSLVPHDGTLGDVIKLVKGDAALRSATLTYRQMHVREVKERCLLFAVACVFEGGKARHNMRGLTGLSLVDIDHVPDGRLSDLKVKAVSDPHTMLCYTTISGKGLRIIFSYELDETEPLERQVAFYSKAFAVGNDHYERLLGVETDRQCKNITRLSGLAHDPYIFYNAEATPFSKAFVIEHATRAIGRVKERRQEHRINSYFNSVVKPSLAAEGVVYGPGTHNEYVMRVGYKLAEKGFARVAAIRWGVAMFPEYDGTEQVFNSCFDNCSPHKRTARNGQTASVEDIKKFLDSHALFRHNEITDRVEYFRSDKQTWHNVNDRMVNTLWTEMSRDMRVNIQDVYRVIESDSTPMYNPFMEYLNGLPEWDRQTDNIQALADTVEVTNTSLWRRCLLKWLVGMVAGWVDDAVVNNVILVLIGEQGAYKTTWFNHLLPPVLRKYFYTKTNANRMSKDYLLTLAQYGLVCCEELDTMRPSKLNQLKAAVTMPSIDERAAYARFHEHRKHIASFCGTGNNAQFLSDPTGNRRWLPFEIEHITSPRERPFNHDGIFAQAFSLYKSGFRFWFDREEIVELNSHNKRFETPKLENELVMLYFRCPLKEENGEFITVARILQIIGGCITQKLNSVCVGRALVEMGFPKARYKGIRGYIVVQRSAEEIRDIQKTMALQSARW